MTWHRLVTRLGGAVPGQLVLVAFIDGLGTGMFLAVSVIFYTRVLHLSAAQIGTMLSVAGISAAVASPLVGRVSNGAASRRMLLGGNVGLAVTFAALASLNSYAPIFMCTCVAAVLRVAARVSQRSVVGHLVAVDQRAVIQARSAVAFNVGMAVGSMGGGVALISHSAVALRACLAVDAATFLLAALQLSRLPTVDHGASAPTGLRRAVADHRFLLVVVALSVLGISSTLISVGLPLWLVTATTTPQWVIGAVTVLNSVIVVLLQTRFAKYGTTPARALQQLWHGGVAIAIGCIIALTAAHVAPIPGVALFLLAAAVISLGEVYVSAGGWKISYSMTPEGSHGTYQGLVAFGNNTFQIVAPWVGGTLLVFSGGVGWIILATGLLCVSATVTCLRQGLPAYV